MKPKSLLTTAGIEACWGWMVAQTNYDPWQTDPPADARRTAALRVLAGSGQALGGSPPGLLAAAGTYPVHSPDTAYTAVMRAGDGSLDAWVRDQLVPEGEKQ